VKGDGFSAPGGVVLAWPGPGEPGATTVNGRKAQWRDGELAIAKVPATVNIDAAQEPAGINPLARER
jgi:hypothetical protein